MSDIQLLDFGIGRHGRYIPVVEAMAGKNLEPELLCSPGHEGDFLHFIATNGDQVFRAVSPSAPETYCRKGCHRAPFANGYPPATTMPVWKSL
ncbi:hypothetical protein ACFLU6_02800 [Acidobacteriota bacterium]